MLPATFFLVIRKKHGRLICFLAPNTSVDSPSSDESIGVVCILRSVDPIEIMGFSRNNLCFPMEMAALGTRNAWPGRIGTMRESNDISTLLACHCSPERSIGCFFTNQTSFGREMLTLFRKVESTSRPCAPLEFQSRYETSLFFRQN